MLGRFRFPVFRGRAVAVGCPAAGARTTPRVSVQPPARRAVQAVCSPAAALEVVVELLGTTNCLGSGNNIQPYVLVFHKKYTPFLASVAVLLAAVQAVDDQFLFSSVDLVPSTAAVEAG